MSNKIKVAILEDHQSVIDGYQYRLSKFPDIEVTLIATSAQDFEARLAAQPVDVLLLDINVPLASGDHSPYPVLLAIPRWLQSHPKLAVLVISVHKSSALIKSVIHAGASGYICKDDNAVIQNLGAVVQIIASGGIYLSEQVRTYLLRNRSIESDLSPRQLQVLHLCAAYPDRTAGDLAAGLQIAHSTFRNLLSEAYLKLGVHNRSGAIAKARQLGLVPPSASEEGPLASG